MRKKIKYILIGVGVGVMLMVCMFILLAAIGLNTKTDIIFYINETGEKLNGRVYLNGELIGYTEDGRLKIKQNNLTVGELKLEGEYKNKTFTLYWDLNETLIQSSKIYLYTTKEELEKSNLSVSELNTKQIEKDVFNEINKRRKAYGKSELILKSSLTEAARAHASDMAVNDYFAFKDTWGRGVEERLTSRGQCTYYASEFIDKWTYTGQKGIAKFLVDDWMESDSAYLIVDKDNRYTHGGVGVSCRKSDNVCYLAVYFADLDYEEHMKLPETYYVYYDLPSENCNLKSKVAIKISSDQDIDVYILKDKKELDRFKYHKPIKSIKSYKRTKSVIADNIEVEPGNILLISNSAPAEADINISIAYL